MTYCTFAILILRLFLMSLFRKLYFVILKLNFYMKNLLLFTFCLLVNGAAFGQTTLLIEDFEDATVNYSANDFTDGTGDYFTRTDGSTISGAVSFTNTQGSSFFAAMDTDGDGEIGFDEFTLLNEEKWRNMDPYAHYKKGIDGREAYIKTTT